MVDSIESLFGEDPAPPAMVRPYKPSPRSAMRVAEITERMRKIASSDIPIPDAHARLEEQRRHLEQVMAAHAATYELAGHPGWAFVRSRIDPMLDEFRRQEPKLVRDGNFAQAQFQRIIVDAYEAIIALLMEAHSEYNEADASLSLTDDQFVEDETDDRD